MSSQPSKKIPLYSAADLGNCRSALVGKCKDDAEKEEQQDLQVRFLQAAEDGEPQSFINWFASCAHDTVEEVSFRAEPFTEKEILDPPLNIEKDAYQALSTLSPRLAALPSFWNSYHLEMIRQGLIEPAHLAKSPRSKASGRKRLEAALEQRTEDALGDCVRSILRHMGGLPEKRGNASVYMDCGIARAWWRGYLSHQIAEDMHLEVDDVWETLRLTEVWEQLMGYCVRRLTAVSDRMIRSALVARLMQEPEEVRKTRESNQSLLEQIGAQCAYQSLGTLTPQENLEIFRTMDIR